MSLVASSICLMNHLSMPCDIANAVAEYIGANSKWIPRYDNNGVLRWKLNPAYFAKLSEMVSHKPDILENFRSNPCAFTINNVHHYTESDSVMIAPRFLSPTEVRFYLYTRIEVAHETFKYTMILCNWSFGETASETHFVKGALYTPSAHHEWDRKHNLTSVEIDNRVISVTHNHHIVQYEWNPYLGVGALMVPPDEFPEPIWVHSP
jgi:hypothetical protein